MLLATLYMFKLLFYQNLIPKFFQNAKCRQFEVVSSLYVWMIRKQLVGTIPLSEIEFQKSSPSVDNMADEEAEAKSNVSSLLAAAKSNEKAEVKRLLLAKTNPDCCDEVCVYYFLCLLSFILLHLNVMFRSVGQLPLLRHVKVTREY